MKHGRLLTWLFDVNISTLTEPKDLDDIMGTHCFLVAILIRQS